MNDSDELGDLSGADTTLAQSVGNVTGVLGVGRPLLNRWVVESVQGTSII